MITVILYSVAIMLWCVVTVYMYYFLHLSLFIFIILLILYTYDFIWSFIGRINHIDNYFIRAKKEQIISVINNIRITTILFKVLI